MGSDDEGSRVRGEGTCDEDSRTLMKVSEASIRTVPNGIEVPVVAASTDGGKDSIKLVEPINEDMPTGVGESTGVRKVVLTVTALIVSIGRVSTVASVSDMSDEANVSVGKTSTAETSN